MIRSTPLILVVVALSFSLVACGDDGAANCDGLTLCTVVGTSCAGDNIVVCAEDAAGCLVQTVDTDCSATGESCDDTGATAVCTGCSDDAACVGAVAGDSFCDGDTTVRCLENALGCLSATSNDCTNSGRICDDSGGSAACFDDCIEDPRCVGSAAGDTSCAANELLTCTVVPGGCLVASVSNCALFGGACDPGGATPAVCTGATCTDHALCAGRTDGEAFCSGDFVNTCNLGANGCLQLSQVGCGPATCAANACTAPAQTGEDCANAYVVTGTTTFSHADITSFANDLEFTDASCQMRANVSDVVFAVALLDGETLSVAEYGGADTVVNLQVGTCGADLACVSSQDDPDTGAQTYTATGAQIVYITVETYFDMPSATDVALSIAIDASCGNGLVEPGEACDDGGTTGGDGCSATCTLEFGYACDGNSPTTCTQIPSIGSFGAADLISDVINPANLSPDYTDSFMITFTDDVILSGSLTAPGAGDPDFYLVDVGNNVVLGAANDGPETFSGLVRAGTYLVLVNIYFGTPAADQGYVLSLSTQSVPSGGTLGSGGTLTLSGGPLVAGASEYYEVTVTADLLLTFDLTSDDGATSDMDLQVIGANGFVTAVADDFNEYGATLALPAGTYVFRFNAYAGAGNATLWNFTATAAALAVPSIGTFAPGAAIPNTSGGPLAQRSFDHYTINFSQPVLLSGTLGGNNTGAVGIFIYSAQQNYVASFDPLTFADLALPAGTYVVQVQTASAALGGGDVDSYTLNLSTTAP